MKKMTQLIGSGLVCLAAAGCAADAQESGAPSGASNQPFAGKKVLVAYYSYSGNTQAVARQIAQAVNGDLFEIQTKQSYPAAYNDLTAQAKQEINAGFTPELTAQVPQMAQYEVVFIGSPNWWGTYAPAVKSFLAQYDFTGKTLVPFFTNGGGGMQHCESDMHAQLPGAHFLKGVSFPGRASGANEKDLQNWLRQLAQ